MRRALLAAPCLLLLVTHAGADDLRGRVVGVTDGDTITVLDASKQQHKIRLNGIDAPESGQAFGQVAKQHLSSLVFGKDVLVIWNKRDQFGRLIGAVTVRQVDASLEQLRAGLAWYFRRYESDVATTNRRVYDAAETAARTTKRGLWRDSNPIAPWVYRDPAARIALSPPRPLPLLGEGRVIGNRNSNIYHVRGCRDYEKVAERNRMYFETEAEAKAAGFRKAQNCG